MQHDDSFYPFRRITRAKKARELYHLLGAQSVRALKALITQNHIKDNPIVILDVDLAMQNLLVL